MCNTTIYNKTEGSSWSMYSISWKKHKCKRKIGKWPNTTTYGSVRRLCWCIYSITWKQRKFQQKRENGITSLFIAVQNDNSDVCTMSLQNNENVSQKWDNGATSIFMVPQITTIYGSAGDSCWRMYRVT